MPFCLVGRYRSSIGVHYSSLFYCILNEQVPPKHRIDQHPCLTCKTMAVLTVPSSFTCSLARSLCLSYFLRNYLLSPSGQVSQVPRTTQLAASLPYPTYCTQLPVTIPPNIFRKLTPKLFSAEYVLCSQLRF
jgi:hypothetical protein